MAKAGVISEIVDVGEINKQLGNVKTQLDEIVKLIDQINKAGVDIKGAVNIQQLMKAQADANTQTKQAIDLTAALTKEEMDIARAKAEKAARTKMANDAAKAEINANAQVFGAYKALSTELEKLRKAAKDAAVQYGANSKEAKELAARTRELDAQIKAVDKSVGQHYRNVGNYTSAMEGLGEALGMLPGPFGAIGAQIDKLSMKMARNPILLAIMAIIGAVMLLIKAFKSTDEGATEMEAQFAKLKAIFDIIIQRLAQVASGLFALFKGDFAGAAEKLSSAFTGVGEQMSNAATAAYNFVYAMDAINDRVTAFISEEARLRNEIAKLKYVYNDLTKSDDERKKALEGIMEAEKKIVGFKKQTAEETYNAKVTEVATMKNIPEDVLRGIVDIPTEMLESVLAASPLYNRAFQKLSDDAKKELEELRAAMIEADTSYYEETMRQQKQLTGFTRDQENERAKISKEKKDKEKKDAETAEQQRLKRVQDEIKAYEEAIKQQDSVDEKSYKLRLDAKLVTTEEFLKKEMDALKKSAEYANLTAGQQAAVYIEAYKRATEEARKKGLKTGLLPDEDAEMAELRTTPGPTTITAEQVAAAQGEVNRAIVSQEAAMWNDRIQLANEFYTEINNIVGQAFQTRMDMLNAEAEQDELSKKRELEAAGRNAVKIDEINARYAAKEKEREKERRRLQMESAKYQKSSAVIGSIINTALAVTNAFATTQPFPLAIVMAALALATGIAQTALIAAQPLPAYAKGRKGGPAELAQINELGQEAVVTTTGQVYFPQSPVVYLPQGSSVIPHDELLQLAGKANTVYRLPSTNTRDNGSHIRDEINGLHAGFAMLAREIRNKRETSVNITERGIWASARRGEVYQEWVDNVRI